MPKINYSLVTFMEVLSCNNFIALKGDSLLEKRNVYRRRLTEKYIEEQTKPLCKGKTTFSSQCTQFSSMLVTIAILDEQVL